MSEQKRIAMNVGGFLAVAASHVARAEEDWWNQQGYSELMDLPITSPIEQLFYVAMKALVRGINEEFNPQADSDDGGPVGPCGVYLVPQHKIGRYTVDFLLYQRGCGPDDRMSVVIELDGHAFHDKDANQRAYEKGRDRFLVKKGHRVLHWTGSEVVADPFAVAHEALEALTLKSSGEYDPADPLGLGV